MRRVVKKEDIVPPKSAFSIPFFDKVMIGTLRKIINHFFIHSG